MTLPKEWYEEKLPAEDGLEIGAGCPAVPCSLPKFTCGTCGGLAAIWWGDGDYLCGFGMDQMWLVKILCDALNEKRKQILTENVQGEAQPPAK